MIIDFHTHCFPESISVRTMETLSQKGHIRYYTEATSDALAWNMKQSDVDYSVNLPVMTKPEQVPKVNDRMIRQKEELFQNGIITFGGLHPAYEDYRSEIRKLKDAGIKGIKLHPAYQGIHINDIAYKRIIGAISEAGLITLVHSGLDVGFMGQNFASVPELLEVVNEVRPEKFVLAHMGGWQGWDDVERDLAGAPVWLDTAFSLGPIEPRPGEESLMPLKENLNEERFVRLARKHGIDKVLFATDSPWARQREYIDFVKQSSLTTVEKDHIFSGNALSLLELPLGQIR